MLKTFLEYLEVLHKRKSNHIPDYNKSGKELYILGNGPSLKNVYVNVPDFFINKRTLCVNHIVTTPYFEKLRPEVYVMIDGSCLGTDKNLSVMQKEQAKAIRDSLVSKVKWPMILCIPRASEGSELTEKVKENQYIQIEYINTRVFKGKNSKLKYSLWEKQYCAPPMENALVAALFIALVMKYSTIYILGADHDWMRNIYVDEYNQVIMNNKHVYKEKQTLEVRRINNENRGERLGELLKVWTLTWNTYYELEKYAEAENMKIYNCTPNSFIDAFQRKKLQYIEKV